MKKVGSVVSPSSEMKPQIAKPALMSPNNVTYVISLSDYCITIIGFSDSLTLMAVFLIETAVNEDRKCLTGIDSENRFANQWP